MLQTYAVSYTVVVTCDISIQLEAERDDIAVSKVKKIIQDKLSVDIEALQPDVLDITINEIDLGEFDVDTVEAQ